MAASETHYEKYQKFKTEAEREESFIPSRIENYFEATFHLIEYVVSKTGIHINKHQNVRRELEANPKIFGDDTNSMWTNFQEMENRIRPGQIYGAAINGKSLKRVQEIFKKIENICTKVENV